MTKQLLTDVDGVLLNWLDPFLKEFSKTHIRKTNMSHFDFHQIEALFYDTEKEDVEKAIGKFNVSREFGELEPIKYAHVYLPLIKEKYGFEVIAITSSNTDALSTRNRLRNLETHFKGIIDDVHFVERKQSKKEVLAEFFPTYWIEDFVPNALTGFEVGHTPIVLEHSYNLREKGDSRLNYAQNWRNVGAIIRRMETMKTIR